MATASSSGPFGAAQPSRKAAGEVHPVVKANELEQASSIFKHPELHVTVDEPNASKQQYSVQQLTSLWNWYKQEMNKHIDDIGDDLRKPVDPAERAELQDLAKRVGLPDAGPPGREDLQPFAYKYKKLKDYDTLKKALKFQTAAEREAQLAAAGAPLDVIPASDIDRTPHELAAAHEAAYQRQREEEEARGRAQAEQRVEYSSDSEWWPQWESPRYEDMPSQPLLRQVAGALAAQKAAREEAAAAGREAAGRAPDKDPFDPVLWRALPVELDPFLIPSPRSEGGVQLVSGARFQDALAGGADSSGGGSSAPPSGALWRPRLSESQSAFLVSALAVVGLSAYRWLRRQLRRGRSQQGGMQPPPAPLL